MRTLCYLAGACWELLTGAPWRDIAGALVLGVTIVSIYAFMLVMTP